jgi:eukaryotic-like serine/threonine-protein kinase
MAEPPRSRITVPLDPSPLRAQRIDSAVNETRQAGRLGKYELVELLGQGGMAEVWRATLDGPGGFSRTLVVKRVLAHLARDAAFIQRFLREGRLSSRLNHSNIVKVFELGEDGGEYFLALEYIEGCDLGTLSARLRGRGPMPPGLGAFVVREVCRGLDYAHTLADEQGRPLRMIHRDISQSNVMLGLDGSVRIVDFGIAKALGELGQSGPGALVGKPAYISPEQLAAKELDHRVDVWAAGVVLHELLTGRYLFRRESAQATIDAIRDFPIPPPSQQNPEVPAELDRVCLKALARDRAQRYRSCEDMGAELQAALHGLRFGADELATLVRETVPNAPVGAHPPLARTGRGGEDRPRAPSAEQTVSGEAETLPDGPARRSSSPSPTLAAPSPAVADAPEDLATTTPRAGGAAPAPQGRRLGPLLLFVAAALIACSAALGLWAGLRR